MEQLNTYTDYIELLQSDIASLISDPIMQDVYEAYQCISDAIRAHLVSEQFLEFKPPLIGPVTDPGIRGAKQVEIEFYGQTYKFMSSAILYKQLLAISRKRAGKEGRIFFFADNLRLEPAETASTDRHLVEFVQVDLELVDADHFVAMEVAEKMVTAIHQTMKEHESSLKKIWEHFRQKSEDRGLVFRNHLTVPSTPYKKYTHSEAIELIDYHLDEFPETLREIKMRFGIEPKKLSRSSEIPWEYEWLLSTLHDEPFFIYDYPKGARGFYDREYPEKPGILMDFDLILPYGYGEVISGAAREFDLSRIIPRMKESGESLQKYKWYLEFLKQHGEPTAGFGIGLERTVRYFCGLPSIHLALPYPKIPGLYTP